MHNGLFERMENIQRQLKLLTGNLEFSYATNSLASSMRILTDTIPKHDLTYTSMALAEAMRPMAGLVASFDYSYTTKALSNAMLPLIANQQLYDVQLKAMRNVTASIVGALDIPLINEMSRATILGVQDLWTNMFKGLDMSYIIKSLSTMSFMLKDVYNIWDLEYTDEDEEQRIDFEEDVNDIVAHRKTPNWQQKFYAKVQKWKIKNPVLAFILLNIILPLVIMILFEVSKHMFITSQQSAIRQEPSIKSEIVVQVVHQEIVMVIGSQPHWLNVVYLSQADGTVYEGWLSKRSCAEIEVEEPEGIDAEEAADEDIDNVEMEGGGDDE